MRKNNLFVTLLLLSLLIGFSAHSTDFGSSSVVPVEWQAINLQENIEGKIKRSLLPIIKPEDYVIEVKIGIDAERAEEPSSKKITKNTQRKKAKFSTAEAPQDGDDFVVFNKLGIEAPLFTDEPVEMQTSEVELSQKAMIEMNDRYNLFNYLTTIDINLTFDKDLPAKTKDSIQKIVKGLSFNTRDVVPQINTQYLALKTVKVNTDPQKMDGLGGANGEPKNAKEKEKKPLQEALDRFKNLDIMIGLIIAALLIAAAMILIAKMGSKHEDESKTEGINEENVEAQNEDETQSGEELPPLTPEEESLLEGEDMNIDLTKTDPATLKIVEGLERFRKVMNHHYNDMALMIKGWIKIAKGDEVMALRSLVQLLSDNELGEIFKCLTIDERATWKMCLNGELKKEELSKSCHFISFQIIQLMMVPSLIDDYELCDLLLALRPEDAAKFSQDNIEVGVIFANVLSAKTIGEMFKLLPVETSAEIIERSAYFKKEDILSRMPELKATMLEFKARRERPPFIKRIVDILPGAKAQLEKKLYATLLQHLSMEEVRELAVSVFPSDLVERLPDSIYRESVSKMPLESQIAYFVSLSDDERDFNLNRFAAKGSKSREMLEVELNSILKNEILVRRVRAEKGESLGMELLSMVREYLTNTSEAQKEVNGMVEAWLKDIQEAEPTTRLSAVA